jgi:DNA-binding MarR family transcriptional regulator
MTTVDDRRDAVHDERITLMGLLVETHAQLVRALGDELERQCGLPLMWFEVLLRLGRSTEHRLTMSQLADGVSLTSGGMTRLVDRMAGAGLVERQDCPSDRRSVHVVLTAAGLDRLGMAVQVHLAGLDRHLLGPLDPAEVAALGAALRKVHGERPVCGS